MTATIATTPPATPPAIAPALLDLGLGRTSEGDSTLGETKEVDIETKVSVETKVGGEDAIVEDEDIYELRLGSSGMLYLGRTRQNLQRLAAVEEMTH